MSEIPYHQNKKIRRFSRIEVQRFLRVCNNEVEPEIHAPEGEEQSRCDEEVGDIGEGAPVHAWLLLSLLVAAGAFAGD